MSTTIEGGCLCGDIRYRITGRPQVSTTCQCRTCRHASAAALVPWIHLESKDLTFTSGTPAAFSSSQSVTRTFCGRCGTPLTYRKESYGPAIDVTTMSLDDPEAFPPIAHVWTSHKLSWLHMTDELPAFPELP